MHCSVCGAAGHRVESCLLPGARLVKKLRQQLKEGTAAPKPNKFKDDRNHASKGRKHKEAARIKHQGSKSPSDKRPRRLVGNALFACKDDDESVEWLCKTGFVRKHKTSPERGGKGPKVLGALSGKAGVRDGASEA